MSYDFVARQKGRVNWGMRKLWSGKAFFKIPCSVCHKKKRIVKILTLEGKDIRICEKCYERNNYR